MSDKSDHDVLKAKEPGHSKLYWVVDDLKSLDERILALREHSQIKAGYNFRRAFLDGVNTALKELASEQVTSEATSLAPHEMDYLVALFIGAENIDDALWNLEHVFYETWLPRFGERRARFLYRVHSISLIWHTLRKKLLAGSGFIGGALGIKWLIGKIPF